MVLYKHKNYGDAGSLTSNPTSAEWNSMVDIIQDAGSAITTKAVIVSDSGSGFILLPNLTDSQRDNNVVATAGKVIWNVTSSRMETYNGSSWVTSAGITSVFDDKLPRLGSDLNANDFNIYLTNNSKIYFDGVNGSTYFKFNTSTQEVELIVGGVLKQSWGNNE